MLESHVPGNSQAWFGEGQLEKGQYMAPRWLPTPLRSGQIRLAEGASLECDMSGTIFLQVANNERLHQTLGRTDVVSLVSTKQIRKMFTML